MDVFQSVNSEWTYLDWILFKNTENKYCLDVLAKYSFTDSNYCLLEPLNHAKNGGQIFSKHVTENNPFRFIVLVVISIDFTLPVHVLFPFVDEVDRVWRTDNHSVVIVHCDTFCNSVMRPNEKFKVNNR